MNIEDTFTSPFNEYFCTYLERHLCRTFNNSEHKSLEGFWCDGISWKPFFNEMVNRDYLSVDNIKEIKKIVTTAYLGSSGQDSYDMTIQLGNSALLTYSHGDSLINCIPSELSMDWIDLDIENRTIELKLK